MPPIGPKILKLLAEEMAASSVTRSELARRLGVTRGRVTQSLAEGANLRLSSLDALEKALGLEFDVVVKKPRRLPTTQTEPAGPWQKLYPDRDPRRGVAAPRVRFRRLQEPSILPETPSTINRDSLLRLRALRGFTED